ncbi:hypothetical protein L484_010337 [Morus notabilis]|uniref:Uncharacterized protein n=1 Tax=Morus notabilis TaxID=981085 RepID=W9QNN8_9ROSA|nr:hypothetical protein L484_010337 [Morus notabilis]
MQWIRIIGELSWVHCRSLFSSERVSYAIVPTISYFEFIPLHKKEQNFISMSDDFIEDEPVPLSQVKVGQEYEIVLTTFTARYRLGNVVEVVGFHNGTPKKDLQIVVEKGSELLVRRAKAELVDFTSHADVTNQPGHYCVICWEIKGEVDERVLKDCCTEMDASFVDHRYVVSRRSNSIGPLELRIVERGTFKKILDYLVGNRVSFSQFKTTRCTNNKGILGILNAGTIQRFHSAAIED